MNLPAELFAERLARSRAETVVCRKQQLPTEPLDNEFAEACLSTVVTETPDDPDATVSWRRSPASSRRDTEPGVPAVGVFRELVEECSAQIIHLHSMPTLPSVPREAEAEATPPPPPPRPRPSSRARQRPVAAGQPPRTCVVCGRSLVGGAGHIVVDSRGWCLRCSRRSWPALSALFLSRARLRQLFYLCFGVVLTAALFTSLPVALRIAVALVAVPLLAWLSYQRGVQAGGGGSAAANRQ